MSDTKYGKYFVSKPIQPPLGLTLSSHPDFDPSEGGRAPPDSGIYLSEDEIPGWKKAKNINFTRPLPSMCRKVWSIAPSGTAPFRKTRNFI
jgi:hypothetical protein